MALSPKLLHQLFESEAEEFPNNIAVISEGRETSNQLINQKANQLANYLCKIGVERGAFVGVVLPRSTDSVISVLGIVKAGCAYIPFDPTVTPTSRLARAFEETQTKVVVTRSNFKQVFNGIGVETVNLDEKWVDINNEDNENMTGINLHHPEDLVCLIYTSGSTGQPKGVMIDHGNLLNLVYAPDPKYQISRQGRFAHVSNPGFDMAGWELWSGLVNGCPLVILPQSVLLNPNALHQAISTHFIQTMYLTSSLFDTLMTTYPQVLEELDVVFVGGEVLDPNTIRSLLALKKRGKGPEHIFNLYGVTECTCISALYEIEEKDVHGHAKFVPIGHPIPNTTLVALSSSLKPVGVGEIGELCIGGAGVSCGYWSNPGLTMSKFVPNPLSDSIHSDGAGNMSSRISNQLYRTGDLVRRLDEDKFEYIGRVDHQVKIQGLRVHPGEIEALLKSHPGVLRVVVLAPVGAGSFTAWVVPTLKLDSLVEESDFREELKVYCKTVLPSYMVPSYWLFIQEIPLTPSGKTDKAKLPKPIGRIEPRKIIKDVISPSSPNQVLLTKIWAQLLKVPFDKISITDNFFDIGGNSLLVIRLLFALIEKLAVGNATAHLIFTHPTIQSLDEGIQRLKKGKEDGEGNCTGDVLNLRKEAILDPSVQFPCYKHTPQRVWDETSCGMEIFLTGATGFLGGFILFELLRKTRARIVCLARVSGKELPLDRINFNLKSYDIWQDEFEYRILPLGGDLSYPLMGLPESTYSSLAQSIGLIYHCASMVNFVKPYSLLRKTNVSGVREIRKFAGSGGKTKPLHFVSSIGVFSYAYHRTPKKLIMETDPITDSKILLSLEADIGYMQSKWVAEQLVWEAIKRGLPAAIYRPGFILCHSKGMPNPGDLWSRIIIDCMSLGCYPDFVDLKEAFITVDYASEVIFQISMRVMESEWKGQAFHICPDFDTDLLGPNPHIPNPNISSNKIFEMINSAGYATKCDEFKEWRYKFVEFFKNNAENKFGPLIPLISNGIGDELSIMEKYENYAVFDTTNTKAALKGSVVNKVISPDMIVAFGRFLLETVHWKQGE